MNQREISGINIEFDEENYMTDSDLWNEEIAQVLAEEEGIYELTDRHFMVINFMRKESKESEKEVCLDPFHARSVCHY